MKAELPEEIPWCWGEVRQEGGSFFQVDVAAVAAAAAARLTLLLLLETPNDALQLRKPILGQDGRGQLAQVSLECRANRVEVAL